MSALRLTDSEWADLQKRGIRSRVLATPKASSITMQTRPTAPVVAQREPIHLDHRVGWCPFALLEHLSDWPAPPKYRSKLEAAYAAYLDALQLAGEIDAWAYEPIELRLADRTRYTPDFVILRGPHLETIEVKGYMRSRDSVRVKVAREVYPSLNLKVVRRVKGVWV